MYNLHCHSLLSDGALLPSEIAVRYAYLGYKAIAITDHVDYSNIKFVTDQILEFCRYWPEEAGIKVLPGVELTHVVPGQFKPLAEFARSKGIKVIVAHGQTTAEPVASGTNRAALLADIDILAHPGKISDADVRLAKARNIFLEITTRKGHALTNRFVARAAMRLGAKLILNHDSHQPEDIISFAQTAAFARKAGLNSKQIEKIYAETAEFIRSKKQGVRS